MTTLPRVPYPDPSTIVGNLTPRQEQILALIGEGMTNREIGERLGVAEKTIKNSVTGLLACLNVQRRAQAAVYATVRRVTADLAAAERGTVGVNRTR